MHNLRNSQREMFHLLKTIEAYCPLEENATLQYLKWQELYKIEKPYQLFSTVSKQELPLRGATNLEWTKGDVEIIHDVRGMVSQFTLDRNGFAFREAPTNFRDFGSTEQIERSYLPEVEDILRREVEGVDQIHFFDWRIRKNIGLGDRTEIDANDKSQHLLPATHVHVDQTPSAVVGRVRLHLPKQADFLLRGRVRIIKSVQLPCTMQQHTDTVYSLWRPIIDVVEDRPLALCDARTVQVSDLVEADHVRKHYSGANYYARLSHNYRWHYLNRQRRDEVTLLKMFDSANVEGKCKSPRSRRTFSILAIVLIHIDCLHTSFPHTKIPAGAAPRESIEVRALIFTYAHRGDL